MTAFMRVCLCSRLILGGGGGDPSGPRALPHMTELCIFKIFSVLFIFFFMLKNTQFCYFSLAGG